MHEGLSLHQQYPRCMSRVYFLQTHIFLPQEYMIDFLLIQFSPEQGETVYEQW